VVEFMNKTSSTRRFSGEEIIQPPKSAKLMAGDSIV
jgi:hypothetical protein